MSERLSCLFQKSFGYLTRDERRCFGLSTCSSDKKGVAQQDWVVSNLKRKM